MLYFNTKHWIIPERSTNVTYTLLQRYLLFRFQNNNYYTCVIITLHPLFVRRCFSPFNLFVYKCPIWWWLTWTVRTYSSIEYLPTKQDLYLCLLDSKKITLDSCNVDQATVRLSHDEDLGGIYYFHFEGRAVRSLGFTADLLKSWMLCWVSELSLDDVSGQRLIPISKETYVFLLGRSDPYSWERCTVPKSW